VIILGIDPGENKSGVVLFDSKANRVLWAHEMEVSQLETNLQFAWNEKPDVIVCENIVPMGVPFSSNLRATCRVIDRLEFIAETLWIQWVCITRNQVKVTLCGRCKGVKDANVSCAVQERFGGRKAALGTKKQPGPLYGVSGHCWQALAAVIAATTSEK
jgi:hypothetical protein